MEEPTKRCSRCRESKPRSEFNKTGNYCKPCLREYSKARYRDESSGAREGQLAWARDNRDRVNELRRIRRADPEYRRRELDRDSKPRPDRWIKDYYGLTRDQWNALLASQGGGCAICGRTEPRPGAPKSGFHVDHDHACCPGKRCCGRCIRGLLCNHCNPMLGHADDDPAVLRSAADYLERWKGRNLDPRTTSGAARSTGP